MTYDAYIARDDRFLLHLNPNLDIPFDTLIILLFHSHFFYSYIISVSLGGAGVQVTKYDIVKDEKALKEEEEEEEEEALSDTFIIHAPLSELFKAAEKYCLLKKTHDGLMKVGS